MTNYIYCYLQCEPKLDIVQMDDDAFDFISSEFLLMFYIFLEMMLILWLFAVWLSYFL